MKEVSAIMSLLPKDPVLDTENIQSIYIFLAHYDIQACNDSVLLGIKLSLIIL